MDRYQTIIDSALREGGLLDALLSLQAEDGYACEAGLTALVEHEGKKRRRAL